MDAETEVGSLIAELLSEFDMAEADVKEVRRRQYELGLAWVSFPRGFGGLGISPRLQSGINRRLSEAGLRRAGSREFFGHTMAAPTLMAHGSNALRDRLLKRAFTGEDSWCQLFSEPGAGSDMAGLSTRGTSRRR